jgi:hypothetical protein
MTPEQLGQARARWREQLAALPPPTEERIKAIAALFNSIRLRQARDKARAAADSPERGGDA